MEKSSTALLCLLLISISSFSKNKGDISSSDSTSIISSHIEKNTSISWKNFFKITNRKNSVSKSKFGGYLIGNYLYYDNKEKDESAGFSVRCVRFYVDGNFLEDFIYRIQAEAAGSPGVDKGPHILDAYLEWVKHPEFKVKIGQYKRPFTFENPMNPWNVGYGTYSQSIVKLSGMSDRLGEHSSGGRDAGFQLQGDLFPSMYDGHYWFHYQIGLFNGQGINHSDFNRNKDLIGGLWLSPLNNLRIGAFCWTGKYSSTITGLGKLNVDRNRWSVGVDYESDWIFRSEYIASEGGKLTDENSYKYAANKADAWYAMLGVPTTSKLKIYGKWDVYRDEKTNDTKTSIYALSFNYRLMKDLMFQLGYAFNQDRSAKYNTNGIRTTIESNYNQITFQTYIRF